MKFKLENLILLIKRKLRPKLERVSQEIKQEKIASIEKVDIREENSCNQSGQELVFVEAGKTDFIVNDSSFSVPVTAGTSVEISISAFCEEEGVEDINKAALANFRFYDKQGGEVLPGGDLAVSPGLGPYRYLKPGNNEINKTVIKIEIPGKTTSMVIRVKAWRPKIAVYIRSIYVSAPKSIPREVSISNVVNSYLDRMHIESGIVIIQTTAPQMGHPSITLRSNRFAKGISKTGRLVFFFPFGGVNSENREYSDNLVQFKHSELADVVDMVAKRKIKNVTYICSSYSDYQAVCMVDLARLYGWKTMYECRDDMEEFKRSGYAKWHWNILEKKVVESVSVVSAVSPRLKDKLNQISSKKIDVALLPNGVSNEFLKKTKNIRNVEILNKRKKFKTIGYIGHLTASWFDWPILIDAAKKNKEIKYEIIGVGEPKGLSLPSNVSILGSKNHDEFIEISKEWSIGIIPFIPSKLTYGVDPNKLYEYLSLALPVISAPMGGVSSSPLTSVYYSRSDFFTLIEKGLEIRYSESDIAELEHYLDSCRWDRRIGATLNLLNFGVK